MRNRNLIALEAALFECFTSYQSRWPQPWHHLWAIHESIARLDGFPKTWRTQKARKAHACVRGCSIEDGRLYVLEAVGPGWGDDLKFCIQCAAMIFYYMQVYRLAPYMGTHWDSETEESVMVKETTYP
jgi:hypothetical protein